MTTNALVPRTTDRAAALRLFNSCRRFIRAKPDEDLDEDRRAIIVRHMADLMEEFGLTEDAESLRNVANTEFDTEEATTP